jgi:endonuclease-3
MQNVAEVVSRLQKAYPDAKYYLHWGNPLQLLVVAILSAQVRDEVVNALSPKLFAKYKTAKDFAEADLKELTKDISSVTFAANKAKYIKNACKILVEKYGGRVPETMEQLTALPGVGRKTAGTILINAFGKIENIPCDVHVLRVSYRLGWTKSKNADKVEQDLMKILPKNIWGKIPYILKAHGKAVCKAPYPICSKCILNNICPKKGVTKKL